MNTAFLHHRLQSFASLLDQANAVTRALGAGEPDAVAQTARYLTDAATVFGALGMSTAENESLTLCAELAGARSRRGPGAGPERRRAAERDVARWALAETGKRLRADYERDAATLQQARDEIAVLVHHAVENRLVDHRVVPDRTGTGARAIWQVLISAQATRSAARLLALRVALPDVLLLVDERFAALLLAETV